MSKVYILLIALAAALLSGCATHKHVSDCPSCLGLVVVHDRVADDAQSKAIYEQVSNVFKNLQASAQPAAKVDSIAAAEAQAEAAVEAAQE